MSVPRVSHDAVLLQNGQVLVVGGYNSSPGYLASAELYNPATGIWTATGSMTTGRASFLMVLLPNGQVLAAGGDGFLTSAELYNPVTGTWTVTGSMTIGNDTNWGVLLQNGEVFNLVELYNPSTGFGAPPPEIRSVRVHPWHSSRMGTFSLRAAYKATAYITPPQTCGPTLPRHRAQ